MDGINEGASDFLLFFDLFIFDGASEGASESERPPIPSAPIWPSNSTVDGDNEGASDFLLFFILFILEGIMLGAPLGMAVGVVLGAPLGKMDFLGAVRIKS